MDKTIQWLKAVTDAPGVSGFEDAVKKLLIERLQGGCEISYDKIGSVIFGPKKKAAGPRIMIAAHMDEIGFMVKTITKEGFLKFAAIGGWWDQVLLGQRVTVMTARGEAPGVIGSKPPHIIPAEERKKPVPRKDMYIDVGAASDTEARETFGIRPGDAIVPFSQFTVMANEKLLLAKAWDNRIGCAAMADTLEALQGRAHQSVVFGVGTVQEEVGLRGAQTSAAVVRPDLAFAIDTCVAGDTPGVTEDQAPAKLGQGVAITFYDASMIPQRKLRDFAIAVAEKNGIPHQLAFTEGGGTDAGRIHLYGDGVPTLVLSIPTRYLHSHHSIIHRDDYEAAVRLLVALAQAMTPEEYERILKP